MSLLFYALDCSLHTVIVHILDILKQHIQHILQHEINNQIVDVIAWNCCMFSTCRTQDVATFHDLLQTLSTETVMT